MKCPVCDYNNDKIICSVCGWEFIVFLSKPNNDELDNYNKKLLEYRNNYLNNRIYKIKKDINISNNSQKIVSEVDVSDKIKLVPIKNELKKKNILNSNSDKNQSVLSLSTIVKNNKQEVLSIDKSKVWIDKNTNLMWQKKYSDKKLKFGELNDYSQILNSNKFATFNDWRIPAIDELLSLISISKTTSGIFIFKKESYFKQELHDSNIADSIWSSTSKNNEAFYVDFNTGRKNFYTLNKEINLSSECKRALAVRNI